MKRLSLVFLVVLTIGITYGLSFQSVAQDDAAALTEQNLAIGQRYFDTLQEPDATVTRALWAGVWTYNDVACPLVMKLTATAVNNWQKQMHKVFSNLKYTLVNIIADEEYVWIHYTYEGNFDERIPEFAGVNPTGELVTAEHVEIFHIEDGQIVEGWWYQDDPVFYAAKATSYCPVPGSDLDDQTKHK